MQRTEDKTEGPQEEGVRLFTSRAPKEMYIPACLGEIGSDVCASSSA